MADWYADDGNRGAAFFVFFLLVGAALVFLWFLAALRGVLVRAEGRARSTRAAHGLDRVAPELEQAHAETMRAPRAGPFDLSMETIANPTAAG